MYSQFIVELSFSKCAIHTKARAKGLEVYEGKCQHIMKKNYKTYDQNLNDK